MQHAPRPRRAHRFAIVLALLATGALGFVQATAQPAPDSASAKLEGTNPSGWRIVWKDDPATRATISWNTDQPGRRHTVYFDTEPRQGKTDAYARKIPCQRSGRYTPGTGEHASERNELYYHHARLQELKPATDYYFVMESDGRVSRELHFRTAPDDDRPFTLIFGGDSRSDHVARRRVNHLIADLTAKRPELIGFAHGGDYISRGQNLDHWTEWMSDHELTAADDGRMLPLVPTRGNHDKGPLFNEVFDFEPDEPNWYGTTIGTSLRLITLDTNASTAGDQRDWLREELPAAREHRWVVVQYHQPAWPAVKDPGSAKQNWVPLFEQHNVDLVCEADGHTIKRTPPIRNGKIDKTGVVYIGEGGLGVSQRTPKTSERWWLQSPGIAGSGHHVQLLEFSPEQLDYSTLLLEGEEVFDRHTLKPRR